METLEILIEENKRISKEIDTLILQTKITIIGIEILNQNK
jgi:hypothetical protein